MNFAGSTLRLAETSLDPGGIIGGLLCLAAVAFAAFMTRRAGRRRRPAGTPIYRRSSPYSRHRRRIDDADGGDSGDFGRGGDSGGGCGGGGGGSD